MTSSTVPPTPRLMDRLCGRLESLRFLTETDERELDRLIESFSTSGTVEHTMLGELADPRPIARPDDFEADHRRLVRSLEVFDRHSTKPPTTLRVPAPLRGLATRMVQALTHVIVRLYQTRLIGEVRTLYALREAASLPGTREREMLTAARGQIDTLAPNLTRATTPLPAFLMGGAAISAVASLLRRSLVDDWGQVAVGVAFVALGLAMFWCVIKASAIARRRARLVLGPPVDALWATIGEAGAPPRDRARMFAVVATLVLFAAWLVVPVVIALVWARL